MKKKEKRRLDKINRTYASVANRREARRRVAAIVLLAFLAVVPVVAAVLK